MTPHTLPWSEVFPWAQIIGGDGQLWSVLPTYPMFPRHITRPGAGRWVLSARPSDMATICIPSEQEAVDTLRQALGIEVLGIQPDRTARIWQCPAILTHWQLCRHLRDFHSTPIVTVGRLTEYETHRWHNGLHQQVSIWPLPISHVHDRGINA